MKKYVVIVSQKFPKTHKRSGETTNFLHLILEEIKKHTLRGNYEYWERRFKQIDAGEAYLSIRVWTGKPYRSKQAEVLRLNNTHKIGLQSFRMSCGMIFIDGNPFLMSKLATIASNDGLHLEDFKEWFKNYKEGTEMALIHFTKFRY